MKKLITIVCVVLLFTGLSGCMGQMALNKKVGKFNLESADSRWGREGLFLLLYPVTYVTSILDLLIFNSIEFWSGTNPINGESPLVDMKVALLQQHGIHNVASAKTKYTAEKITMYITFKDGTEKTVTATKVEDVYRFYDNEILILEIKSNELKNHHAAIKAKLRLAQQELFTPLT
jgi:Domain of unknown function (DUF3332)